MFQKFNRIYLGVFNYENVEMGNLLTLSFFFSLSHKHTRKAMSSCSQLNFFCMFLSFYLFHIFIKNNYTTFFPSSSPSSAPHANCSHTSFHIDSLILLKKILIHFNSSAMQNKHGQLANIQYKNNRFFRFDICWYILVPYVI